MKYLLFALLFIFLASCGVSDSSNGKNLVAFHAYNDLGRQIYTVNFDDPKNSLVRITNNDHQNIEPLFSYGKEYLIYSDLGIEASGNYAQWKYDFGSKNSSLLEVVDFPYPIVYGRKKIWHPSNDKIYLGNIPGAWAAYDIYEYTFSTKIMKSLTQDLQNTYWPVGFLDPDTLISAVVDENRHGIYKMDLNGNVFDKFNNPHFDRPIIDGIVQYGPQRYHYSMESQTFLMAMITIDTDGYLISATNIDGSYYEEFTSGEFIDDYPVFGPNNDYIIFSRRPIYDLSGHGSQLLYIKISDGSEHVLVDESMFPNLYGFTCPSF